MSTDRQVNANRQNAQRSTGPRSAEGRAKAALNARRHGFSRPPPLGAGEAAEAERLARELARDRPQHLHLAREAAEFEMQLRRIRRAREILLHDAERDLPNGDVMTVEEREAAVTLSKVNELARLQGYERRLNSRWRKALKQMAR